MSAPRLGGYVLAKYGDASPPLAALVLSGFGGARGGIELWQVIDLDNELGTYVDISEVIAVLDERGVEGPDSLP